MLEGESKIYKHPKASTLYLTIPSNMATDSQFFLRGGDKVKLQINSTMEMLIVTKKETGK